MSAHNKVQQIEYNGVVVAERGEMMSLTDMWRAAGADESKRPAEWLRQPATVEFVECVAAANMGNAHIKSRRGAGGGTFANWQIGLAYAKYLDPIFHMKCNEIVRERMEGKSVAIATLPPEVLEMIRRDDGISRQLSHKVVGLEKAVATLLQIVKPNEPILIRRGKTAGQIWARYDLPRLKSAATWLGNRLVEMGCMLNRYDRGDTAIRLFDPDRVEIVMKNGLLHRTRQYIAERQGQGKLRLVGGAE